MLAVCLQQSKAFNSPGSSDHNFRRQVAIRWTLQIERLRHGELRTLVQVHAISKMMILGFKARHLVQSLGPYPFGLYFPSPTNLPHNTTVFSARHFSDTLNHLEPFEHPNAGKHTPCSQHISQSPCIKACAPEGVEAPTRWGSWGSHLLVLRSKH